jgi:hypothetical protein
VSAPVGGVVVSRHRADGPVVRGRVFFGPSPFALVHSDRLGRNIGALEVGVVVKFVGGRLIREAIEEMQLSQSGLYCVGRCDARVLGLST